MNPHIAAQLKGEKFFFLNKPCPKGHNTLRYTANRRCVDCARNEVRELRASWNKQGLKLGDNGMPKI